MERRTNVALGHLATMEDAEFRQRYLLWAQDAERRAESFLSPLLVGAYRVPLLRRACYSVIRRLEGGYMHSTNLRRILKTYHGVSVGRYSYGPCLLPDCLPPGSIVGSYCSIADGLSVFRRNHPSSCLSQHPFFYNKRLGLLHEDAIGEIASNSLIIGSDVWIGAGVTILPGCARIGDGAIIGAASVVTRDVEPFTINVGNPARRIRERYPPEIRALVERSQWWRLSLQQLVEAGELLTAPLTKSGLEAFVACLENGDDPAD